MGGYTNEENRKLRIEKILPIFAPQVRSIAAGFGRGRKVRATQSAEQVNGLMFVRA